MEGISKQLDLKGSVNSGVCNFISWEQEIRLQTLFLLLEFKVWKTVLTYCDKAQK